jgi:hypothetical protein
MRINIYGCVVCVMPNKITVMQKTLFFVAVMGCLMACNVNRNVYKASDFDNQAAATRLIAVLPFQLNSTGYRPRNVTEQDLQQSNERWGYTFQESLHSFLLNRSGRKRTGPVTQFQPLQKTNAILREQNLDIMALYQKQPEELARLLGVDAVVMTTLEQHKNMSDGAAYGLAAARTVLSLTSNGVPGTLWINSDNVRMNCYLYQAGNSNLQWRTFRQGGTSMPANVQGQIDFFCDWIARKFPYRS